MTYRQSRMLVLC